MTLKKIIAVILISVAMITSGCSQNLFNKISKPSISIKSMTQVSDNYYVTATCELPDEWKFQPKDFFTLISYDKYMEENKIDELEDTVSHILTIKNYSRMGGTGNKETEDVLQCYEDLFSGKPDKYKLLLNYHIFNTYHSNNADASFQKNYLKKFKSKLYEGANGKILELQYSFEARGKIYHRIDCIRKDIPYIISGGFNEDLAVSSGDIALWAASTLEVIEDIP